MLSFCDNRGHAFYQSVQMPRSQDSRKVLNVDLQVKVVIFSRGTNCRAEICQRSKNYGNWALRTFRCRERVARRSAAVRNLLTSKCYLLKCVLDDLSSQSASSWYAFYHLEETILATIYWVYAKRHF